MLDAVLAANETDRASDFVTGAVSPGDGPAHIAVPDAHLLFNGDFLRVGSSDLKIVGDDGKSFFIRDYFASDKLADLVSPEGAALSADVVAALAGPLAPGQWAQAGAQPSAQPVIGRVDALSGGATVVRNGVAVTLNIGDTVRKGDVVQTAGGSTVAIVFADGSTFSISANARMVLNEFVYNAGGNNSALISLVQGTFSFVAGQVAKNGDMRVETPVATMGIRGTAVLVEISANDGQTRFSVMVEPDGTTGSFNLYDRASGALIGTVNNSGVGWLVIPSGPLQVVAQQVQKTPAQLQQEIGIVQQIFTIFNNNQQNPFVPDQQQDDPSRRGDNPNDPNPQTAALGGGSGSTTGTTPSDTSSLTPLQQNGQTNITVTVTPIKNPLLDPTWPVIPAVFDPLPPVPLPIGTVTIINGTDSSDDGNTGNPPVLVGTRGDDIIYGRDGDDIIVANSGGNDVYDGGNGKDTLTFTPGTGQGENVNGVAFNLKAFTQFSTAQSKATGRDQFTNIEKVVGSVGNDMFVLHENAPWILDGGAGADTLRLASGVHLRDDGSSAQIQNIEVIDLSATGENVVDLDLATVMSAADRTVEVRGNFADLVNFLNNDRAEGRWVRLESSDKLGFDKYVFSPYGNYLGEGGEGGVPQQLATVYLQRGIQTGGDVIKSEIIENVTVDVTTPEGFALTSETLYTDLVNSAVIAETVTAETLTLYDETTDRTYFIQGSNFSFNPNGAPTGGTVNALEIADASGTLVTADGFDFSLKSLFDSIEKARTTGSTNDLDSVFQNASYQTYGSSGDDSLSGGAFRDNLQGGGGDDTLTGNGGRDTLDGGAGNDILTGGTGNDVFIYNTGYDTITDFTIGTDKIDLTALQYIHSLADILPRALPDGETGDTTINFGDGHSLVLAGINLEDLTEADFTFYKPPHLVEDDSCEDTSSITYDVRTPDGEATTFNSSGWIGGYAVEFNSNTYTKIGTYGSVTYNITTGELTYTLDNNDPATQALAAGQSVTESFELSFTDESGQTITRTATFTIDGTNDAPVVDCEAFDDVPEATVGQDFAYQFDAQTFTDVDHPGAGALTYTVMNLVDGAYEGDWPDWLHFDPATRTFSGTPSVSDYGTYLILVTATDPQGASAYKTFELTVSEPPIAPIIHLGEAGTLDGFNSTTLTGVSISDPDEQPTDPYHVTVTSQYGSLELFDPEFNALDQDCSPQSMEFAAAPLDLINEALADGVIYNIPEIDLENPVSGLIETVTLTVTDPDGNSDSMNFIFSVHGEAAVELAGEYGNHKDVLFSTVHNDTLTGRGGADTFVFSNGIFFSGESSIFGPGHDTITDFNVNDDKILIDKLPIASIGDLTFSQGEGNSTIINLGQSNSTITLNGAAPDQLSTANFIFHPEIYNPYA